MSDSQREFQPIGPSALHLVIDMQRLFAEDTAWRVPGFFDVVPAIRRIAEAHGDRTLFTRFVTPAFPDEAAGRWRRYYRRWSSVTLDVMPAAMLDIEPSLAPFAVPERICDKTTFSGFGSGFLEESIARHRADTVILTGVETDVCVLATALSAVDRSLRVVVVADAVTSGSPAAHAATLDAVLPRFEEQIDIVSVDHLLAAWPAE